MKPETSGNPTKEQPLDPSPRGPAAAARSIGSVFAMMKGGKRDLLVMTCLGAIDGTIVLLAATGGLSSWSAAIVAGLTIVTGVGAWLAARDAFAGGREWFTLGAIAIISTTATVAAAWLGVHLGAAVTLHVLPKAAGIFLCVLGAQMAGLRIPSPQHVPAPLAVLAGGLALEGIVQWTP